MKKQDFDIDTTFGVTVDDFQEKPEDNQELKPIELTDDIILDDEPEPVILNGCCCSGGGCCGGSCGCC